MSDADGPILKCIALGYDDAEDAFLPMDVPGDVEVDEAGVLHPSSTGDGSPMEAVLDFVSERRVRLLDDQLPTANEGDLQHAIRVFKERGDLDDYIAASGDGDDDRRQAKRRATYLRELRG